MCGNKNPSHRGGVKPLHTTPLHIKPNKEGNSILTKQISCPGAPEYIHVLVYPTSTNYVHAHKMCVPRGRRAKEVRPIKVCPIPHLKSSWRRGWVGVGFGLISEGDEAGERRGQGEGSAKQVHRTKVCPILVFTFTKGKAGGGEASPPSLKTNPVCCIR